MFFNQQRSEIKRIALGDSTDQPEDPLEDEDPFLTPTDELDNISFPRSVRADVIEKVNYLVFEKVKFRDPFLFVSDLRFFFLKKVFNFFFKAEVFH